MMIINKNQISAIYNIYNLLILNISLIFFKCYNAMKKQRRFCGADLKSWLNLNVNILLLLYFLVSNYQNMDREQEIPDKRFQDYQEVYDNDGVAIGFKLPGSEFLFEYNQEGGWKDEKGNLYNSKGVLIKKKDQESDDDQEGEQGDEEILDQFERMLQEEDQGIPRAKSRATQKPSKSKESTENKQGQQNCEAEISKFLQNYKNKENIRQGLPVQLHIFFKMRNKFYERIPPKAENTQSIKQFNTLIKEIKKQAEEKTQKLKEKNRWIGENDEFQYSGVQLGEATYDRYWYGIIKANPDNYNEVLDNISKSEEFALLSNKSFHALKSKFYLKKKMHETIKDLGKILEGKEDDDLVKIQINNLPENFPCSFILDLCTFSGTPIQEIHSIYLINQFSADLLISKQGALKFINVEGYCHDEKEYIELDVKEDKEKRKLAKTGMYKISVDTDKQNPYKPHARELGDVLALQKSGDEFAKLYPEEEEKKNGGFRFIVGVGVLKRVLMFRGNSLNVLKIEVFQK